MKRKFTKLMAAFALLVGLTIPMGVWGQTATFTPSDFTGQGTSGTGSAISATVNGVTFACDKGFGTSEIRCYSGGVITISSSNTITALAFTFSGGRTGGLEESYSGLSTTSWQQTLSSQARFTEIVVTYTGGDTPQPTTYTVTYDCNGGTSDCPEDVTDIEAGSQIQLAAAPAKTDYIFTGWYDGTTTYQAGASYTVNGNVTMTAQWQLDVDYLFYESFDNCNGTGGNDNQWSGTIASSTLTPDNEGWTFANGSGAYKCAKFGTSSKLGSAQTPSISYTGNATLTFKAAAWNGGSESTTLKLSATSGTLSASTITLEKGAWTDYTITITGITTLTQIKFEGNTASNGRFFLDEVMVVEAAPSTEPSISANNVSLEYNAESGSIAYTINNGVDGGTLTANTQSDWLTLGQVGETVPFTCTVNEAGTARPATVTLSYTYNRETVTKDVTVTQAGNPNAVMTIADVRAQGTGSVATKGVVTSCFGTTGYIQDATAAICVYGNSLNVGDEIRVSGTLTTYHGLLEITDPQITVLSNGNTVSPTPKTIAEINADDYTLPTSIQGLYVTIEEATVTAINGQNTTIAQGENTIVVRGIYSNVSYNVNDVLTLDGNIGCYDAAQIANPQNVQVQVAPSITFDPDVVDLDAEMQTIQIPFTYDNIVVTNYESFAVHHYDAEGEEIQNTTGTPWYIPGVTGTNDDGYNLTVFVSANEGEARSAYMKVSALDAGGTTVYSNLVTVNQAAYVAPFTPANYTKASEIVSGHHYIIVGVNENDTFAMGEQKQNNRSGVLVSADGNTITVTSEEVYDFVIESSGDNYTIYDARTPGYLYAASSSSNYLRTTENNNNDGVWEIDFDANSNEATVIAQGNNTRKYMRFNYNSGNPVFSCYAESSTVKTKVYFYEKSNVIPSNYTLDVTGYGNNAGGYKLIASPVTSVTPSANNGFIASEAEEYDLYAFDGNEELEWRNYKAGKFNLESGKGYLYANKNDVTLSFAGTAYTGDGQVDVIAGYNLVGNPYAVAATLEVPYYRLNAAGSELNASTESSAVDAMEGVFVQATEAGYVNFTTSNSGNGKSNAVVMNLSRNRGAAIDRAIVRFDEGQQLSKFQLNPNSTKLYIPQGNKDFAIVRSAAQGEMPVSFRASENGTYTLAVEAENVEMNYLHLIDNMTGMDVDLLQTPNYTFEAKTSDYASRFRLVFSANGTTDNEVETFAYFNGSNWTVNNLGEATLQVVDVTGRTVSSETINGNATISLNQPAGIYMMRLVNGNGVKVQKVVVK